MGPWVRGQAHRNVRARHNKRCQPPAGLTTKPSTLQVLRNVENAVKQIGGTVVETDQSKETMKLTKDGSYAPVASTTQRKSGRRTVASSS